jgi:hypothetical protein
VTTPLSDVLETARKRLLTAALDERDSSPRLVTAVNRVLVLTAHPLALKDGTLDATRVAQEG